MSKSIFPAEWYPQDAILITWPHTQSAWKETLQKVEATYISLAAEISHYQDLIIQIHPSIDKEHLSFQLSKNDANLGRCHFTSVASNDTWARDHGPISIIEDKKPKLLNFIFNGWGGKFESGLDNNLNSELENKKIVNSLEHIKWVLEGGSIESDGSGTILTTTQCLLNPNRNGNTSKKTVEAILSEKLGIHKFLWLTKGYLEGDDTDAHIDTLARFSDKDTIIFQGCNNPEDSHYQCLSEMKQELTTFTTTDGNPYQLIELPLPSAKFSDGGDRLPATYANFLITNKLVVVPTYDDKNDELALSIIKQAFPNHLVKGIDALPLIEEHGSIHCITMQLIENSVNFDSKFERLKPTLG